MELLEVRGRACRVLQHFAAQLRAAGEELPNERPVEHFLEDVRVADTVLALQALAKERDFDVELRPSQLLPGRARQS